MGIQVSYANKYHAPEIVPISSIDSPFAHVEVDSAIAHCRLSIAISFDHVRMVYLVDVQRLTLFLKVGAEPDDFDDYDA